MYRFISALLYFLSGFFRRNPRKIVLGAWMGKKFADNPKFLLLYLAEQRYTLDLVWIADQIVRSSIPADLPVRFVLHGSWAARWERLTAGACFVTHGFSDVGRFNLMRGARKVYLGHGLAIKHMGSKDTRLGNQMFDAFRRLIRCSYAYDYYIASAPLHRAKLLVENATCNIKPEQIIDCGQPRIDFLLKHSNSTCVSLRSRFLAEHRIPAVRRVITYLPTFRDKGTPAFSFTNVDPEQLLRLHSLLIELDAVILEKSHFAGQLRSSKNAEMNSNRVYSLSGSANIDTQELLMSSDLLITDYSGCYVDFLALNRPVIHFAYDRYQYETRDRGLYFNLNDVAGGPIVADFESLCVAMKEVFIDAHSVRVSQEAVKFKLTQFESATSCEQLAEIVLRQATASSHRHSDHLAERGVRKN
jgi:CDP-glycerol glycerophosphotransferase (TagB/SpsB family)